MNPIRLHEPAVTDFPPLTIPQPTTTLVNDICFNFLEGGQQPVNQLTLSWDAGSLDVPSQAALNLMARLLREGAGPMNGAEISEALDFNGAWLKADVSNHNLTLTLTSLNATAHNLYELLKLIITRPTFPESEFMALRDQMAKSSEIAMKKVSLLASVADKELSFGTAHPMSRQTPTAQDYLGVTRQDVIDLWQHTIAAVKPEIFLSGQIATLKDSIIDTFSTLSTTPTALPYPIRIIKPSPSGERWKIIEVDEALQSAVAMSIATIDRANPDYIDLRLAVMALGGYFGSRLMSVIREEKGLTYGISSSLLGYREGGFVAIASQTDPRYVKPLIKATLDEIERMRTEPISPTELVRLKRHASSSLSSILDSPFSVMDNYIIGKHNLTGADYFARQQEAINKLTAERVMDVMKRHVNESSLKISIAGPKKIGRAHV